MIDSAVESGNYMADLVMSAQWDYRAKLETEGVTFVDDVDIDAFRAATEVVYTKFPDWSPDLYQNVRAILDK